jgi:hypothetical protein
MSCTHLLNNTCQIASRLAETTVPTTSSACVACSKEPTSQGYNRVTCSIAYSHIRTINPTKAIELLQRIYEFRDSSALYNRPGSALRRILKLAGIKERADCPCKEYSIQMDCWGTNGCLTRRQEIIEHLNAQAPTWYDILKVALNGYITTGQLVDEAIRLSLEDN